MTTRGLVSAAAFSLAGCASAPLLAARGADALLRELVERHRFQGAVVIGHGPRRPGRVRRRIRLCRHRTATALHARHADRWRLDGSARDRAARGPGTARRRAQHRHHTGQLARLGRRQTADGKRETANGATTPAATTASSVSTVSMKPGTSPSPGSPTTDRRHGCSRRCPVP